MQINPGIMAAVAIGAVAWLYVRWRSPRPEFPPLRTSPDDPLMLEALAKARATLGEFLSLVHAPGESAHVKLYFVSNSNQVEHVWAEVLSVPNDEELEVRLVTPPVTHSGQLERLYHCKLSDIEDWQVRDVQGRIHGGFSQRAMFAIARRDGIKLPKKLLEDEKEYA